MPYDGMQTDATREVIIETLVSVLDIEGDVAECGVYNGATAEAMATTAQNKTLHLFDVFSHLPIIKEWAIEPKVPELWQAPCPWRDVRETLKPFGDRVKVHGGLFSQTLPQRSEPLCFLHADADYYKSTLDICEYANRVMVVGGKIVFHDYDDSWPGVQKAVEEILDLSHFELERVNSKQAIATRVK